MKCLKFIIKNLWQCGVNCQNGGDVVDALQKVLKNITSDGRIQATKYKFYILECDNT